MFELVNHLTIHYSYTRRLWEKVCGLLNISWVFPDTIQHFFNGWKPPSNNVLVLRLWDFILLFLCWGVWKEWNDRVYRGVESNINQMFCKIKNLVSENIRSSGKGQQPQNEWEDLVI